MLTLMPALPEIGSVGHGQTIIGIPPPGAACRVNEPIELDTFTIRGAGPRRNNGSIALVTVTTPKTFAWYACRTSPTERCARPTRRPALRPSGESAYS